MSAPSPSETLAPQAPSFFRTVFLSRVSSRLVLGLLLCIGLVEATVFLKEYENQRESLLLQIVEQGRDSLRQALAESDALRENFAPLSGESEAETIVKAARPALGISALIGLTLYDSNNNLVVSIGHAPLNTPNDFYAASLERVFREESQSIEALWPATANQSFVTVARLQAAQVAPALRRFALESLFTTLLNAAAAALVTMVIFGTRVLMPLFLLRRNIQASSIDPSKPEQHLLPENRSDEIGQIFRAFNATILRIASDLQSLHSTRAALLSAKQELETKVEDRTSELLTTNKHLESEIQERSRAEEQLRHDAFHDRLSGLPNRHLLLDRINHAIAGLNRSPKHNFALVALNLDRFKIINDSLGHEIGDHLIKEVAERLKEALRPNDSIARGEGDGFLVLLSDISVPQQVNDCVQRLSSAVNQPFMIDAQEIFLRASFGTTLSSYGYVNGESMIQDALSALAQAKVTGKDRMVVFEPDMRSSRTQNLRLEAELQRAVTQGKDFELDYQPIIKIATGMVIGFEALVRWRHPRRGRVPPGDFIPLAEETGLIVPLGNWVMIQAAKDAHLLYQAVTGSDHPQDGPEDHPQDDSKKESPKASARNFFVSINISGRQLIESDVNTNIKNALQNCRLASQHLKLEITETVLMRNPERANTILRDIKSLGAGLAIDDFGTGYSSLSYLQRFPFDTLKVDRSFVSAIDSSSEGLAIVRAVISLAKALQMEVVAEGIESETQVAALRGLGCAFGQGFYYSTPMTLVNAIAFAENQRRCHAEVKTLPGTESRSDWRPKIKVTPRKGARSTKG